MINVGSWLEILLIQAALTEDDCFLNNLEPSFLLLWAFIDSQLSSNLTTTLDLNVLVHLMSEF